MEAQTKEEMEEMISQFENKPVEAKVVSSNPVNNFLGTVIDFVEKRMEEIEEDKEFKEVIKEKILDKIQTDETVTLGNLMNLYRIVQNESSVSTNSILELFKSGKGEGSGGGLLTAAPDVSEGGDVLENLTSKDMQNLEALARAFKEKES